MQVPPGYPHGDAWSRIMGYPPSHDTERYLKTLAETNKGKKGK